MARRLTLLDPVWRWFHARPYLRASVILSGTTAFSFWAASVHTETPIGFVAFLLAHMGVPHAFACSQSLKRTMTFEEAMSPRVVTAYVEHVVVGYVLVVIANFTWDS